MDLSNISANRNVKTIEQANNYLLNGPLKSYETNGFGLSLVELKAGPTPNRYVRAS